jgi:hypothetical protein
MASSRSSAPEIPPELPSVLHLDPQLALPGLDYTEGMGSLYGDVNSEFAVPPMSSYDLLEHETTMMILRSQNAGLATPNLGPQLHHAVRKSTSLCFLSYMNRFDVLKGRCANMIVMLGKPMLLWNLLICENCQSAPQTDLHTSRAIIRFSCCIWVHTSDTAGDVWTFNCTIQCSSGPRFSRSQPICRKHR